MGRREDEEEGEEEDGDSLAKLEGGKENWDITSWMRPPEVRLRSSPSQGCTGSQEGCEGTECTGRSC